MRSHNFAATDHGHFLWKDAFHRKREALFPLEIYFLGSLLFLANYWLTSGNLMQGYGDLICLFCTCFGYRCSLFIRLVKNMEFYLFSAIYVVTSCCLHNKRTIFFYWALPTLIRILLMSRNKNFYELFSAIGISLYLFWHFTSVFFYNFYSKSAYIELASPTYALLSPWLG